MANKTFHTTFASTQSFYDENTHQYPCCNIPFYGAALSSAPDGLTARSDFISV
jgi:hypothetical protein